MSPDRKLLAFAGFNGAMAVIIGAFAAHGASPYVKGLLTTGGQYQMIHAALAVAVALSATLLTARIAGWLACTGGLIFCLSLASIGLLSLPVMGAVAPVGGVLMIAGWVVLIFAALQSNNASN